MRYNVSVARYSENKNASLDPLCNGWTAINIGTTVAMINDIPLNPGIPGINNGESFSIGGNVGEVFKGSLSIVFPYDDGVGDVLIIQKFYYNECGTR